MNLVHIFCVTNTNFDFCVLLKTELELVHTKPGRDTQLSWATIDGHENGWFQTLLNSINGSDLSEVGNRYDITVPLATCQCDIFSIWGPVEPVKAFIFEVAKL